MYHTIQFAAEFMIDLETSARSRLERLLVRAGDQVLVQIRPYVVETADGPVEMADLFFADGTGTRGIPYANFTFVE